MTSSIIFRKLENPKLKRSIAVATRKKRPLKPAAFVFLEHLRTARQTFKLPTTKN
jgi:hypothetical protein